MYSRKLTYHDYGQFQTVWVYSSIISVIISFGLSSIILSSSDNFFSVFLKRHKTPILRSYFLGALLTFLIFYFTTSYFSVNTKLLLVAFILLQSVCTLTDTLLIKNNQLAIYVWLNVVYSILFFAIHLYFFYNTFIINHWIFCISCLYLLKAVCIYFVSGKTAAAENDSTPLSYSVHWIFLGINDIAGILARWLDKIFLLYLLAPADFAVFFNGAFEIPFFGILISTMEQVMLANISSNISNREAARHTFKESFKILSVIAFPLFFFLLIMHTEAFAVIFNNKYNASIPVFLVSIFIIPVRITHYGVILQCYGQSNKILFGSIADIILSLLLMFILYPLLGMAGVALAIVVSTYLQAIYYLWQSRRLLKVKWGELVPGLFLLKLLIALALAYAVLYYVKDSFSNLVSLIGMFVITAIIIVTGLARYWKKEQRGFSPGKGR